MTERCDVNLEAFAVLEARLDDPFAERAAVLAAAALSEEASARLAERWRARLAEPSSDLAERFAAAYARERQVLLGARRGAGNGARPGPSSAETRQGSAMGSSPVEPRAASVNTTGVQDPSGPTSRRQVVAETSDIGELVPRPALPFVPAPAGAAPPRPTATRAPQPKPRIDLGTADISPSVPHPALPFAATPRPAPVDPMPPAPRLAGATEPRKRWILFDPQTGQPLPEPRWVELPDIGGDPTTAKGR